MEHHHVRKSGRLFDQLREITVTYNPFSYATSSVLIELGHTKVFCSVSLQNGVPFFLRGKGSGWLTAEYNLLPHATHQRATRDLEQKNGRSIEIARVIGRSFRSVVDLSRIYGEKTIHIDCDVLQADGGTRVAALIGSSLALLAAQTEWIRQKLIKSEVLSDFVIAVSIGIIGEQLIVDPDFSDDLLLDADFNIIGTFDGHLIEIQGGAEKKPVSQKNFSHIQKTAFVLLQNILDQLEKKGYLKHYSSKKDSLKEVKEPFFTLEKQLFALQKNSND
jgi:ribonuclease PH